MVASIWLKERRARLGPPGLRQEPAGCRRSGSAVAIFRAFCHRPRLERTARLDRAAVAVSNAPTEQFRQDEAPAMELFVNVTWKGREMPKLKTKSGAKK